MHSYLLNNQRLMALGIPLLVSRRNARGLNYMHKDMFVLSTGLLPGKMPHQKVPIHTYSRADTRGQSSSTHLRTCGCSAYVCPLPLGPKKEQERRTDRFLTCLGRYLCFPAPGSFKCSESSLRDFRVTPPPVLLGHPASLSDFQHLYITSDQIHPPSPA